MKNLIRVEDTKLYLAKNYIGANKSLGQCLDEVPTVNAIEIPENPTNGDIIKAIFNISDSEMDEGLSTTYIYTKTRVLKGGSQDHLKEQITFNRDWWNAPYEKGANRT